MDRFLEKSATRSPITAGPEIEAPASAYSAAAEAANPRAPHHTHPGQSSKGDTRTHSSRPPEVGMEVSGSQIPTLSAQTDTDTDRIAKAVAALLMPGIHTTVANAITSSLAGMQREIKEHNDRLNEVEQRVSNLEDDMYQLQGAENTQDKTNQFIMQKLEDLENRSRRSNLRFVGFPESIQSSQLLEFCSSRIPEALGLPFPVPVERAHRIGPFNSEKSKPRAVIAKYLNFMDKSVLLQKFRQTRSLQIEGMKILIFADYSADVSKKRKAFQNACSQLFQHQLKFTLAFPAVLKVKAPNGNQLTFHDPNEAELFIRSLHSTPVPDNTHSISSPGRPMDQRSPRKDPPKRTKYSTIVQLPPQR